MQTPMRIIAELDALRSAVKGLRLSGSVALVPTMGALHEGHLTLVREAKKQAEHVVVSIFVNPLQFGENEDLDAYPRVLERDCKLLDAEGVTLVWAPSVEVMYPKGFASSIAVTGESEGLCGGSRPGHFDGVATVVCKLFNQVQPNMAFFGEKDWQQLAVIRRMARDLDMALPEASRIIGVPTVREADGLAMSSRNAYLSVEERAQAAALPRAMREAIVLIEAGGDIGAALAELEQVLIASDFTAIDYAEVRDAQTLLSVEKLGKEPGRLLVAARIGKARLIDNMSVCGKTHSIT